MKVRYEGTLCDRRGRPVRHIPWYSSSYTKFWKEQCDKQRRMEGKRICREARPSICRHR